MVLLGLDQADADHDGHDADEAETDACLPVEWREERAREERQGDDREEGGGEDRVVQVVSRGQSFEHFFLPRPPGSTRRRPQ